MATAEQLRNGDGHEADNELDAVNELAKHAAQQQEKRGWIEFREDGSIGGYDFDGLWRLATMYARSGLVPKHFKGKVEDCAIAIQMAQRCKVDIFAYLQNCYVVHGRPGVEAKFAIAMLNQSGKIVGTIDYDMSGKEATQRCRAMVTDASSGELVFGPDVTWDLVRKEGWDKPNGSQVSKWKTMPDLMFQYRSAIFLIRTRYPEVILGIQTRDELEDIAASESQGSRDKIEIPVDDEVAELAEPEEDKPEVVDDPPGLSEDELHTHVRGCETMRECDTLQKELEQQFPSQRQEIYDAFELRREHIAGEKV